MIQKRGQTALEFLTTYGWAIFLVAMMLLVMAYFGVVNPEALVPESCNFQEQSGISCLGVDAWSDGSITLKLQNNRENVILTETGCTAEGDGVTTTRNVEVGGLPAASTPWLKGQFLDVTCRFDGDNPFAGHAGELRKVTVSLGLRTGDKVFVASAPVDVKVAAR